VNNFLECLVEENTEKGFEIIEKVSRQNLEMNVYLKMILVKLRYALMLRYALSTKKIEEYLSQEDLDFILKLIENKAKHISSRTLYILLDTYQNLKNAVIDELPLELALVKILNGEESDSI
jgi:DNA polymerase III gamma/tau subunit